MASYDSEHVNQPGQYPAPAWTKMGLPAQNQDTGAAGGPPFSSETDKVSGDGNTNQPGQYPSRMPFSTTGLDGTGAPGTGGISGGHAPEGPDHVDFQKDAVWKSQFEEGGLEQGAWAKETSSTVSGKGDWTQANDVGYQAPARYQMPGTAQVSLDAGGDGTFQPNGGRVRRGGFMNGQR